MTPNQLRIRMLTEHSELRSALADLDERSREALDGRPSGYCDLRTAGRSVLFQLERHMRREEEHLIPILQTVDAWGEARASRVEDEHRRQRAEMCRYLEMLERTDLDDSHVAMLLLDLTEWLARDMDEEEQTILHPDLLRDDVVAIHAEAG